MFDLGRGLEERVVRRIVVRAVVDVPRDELERAVLPADRERHRRDAAVARARRGDRRCRARPPRRA